MRYYKGDVVRLKDDAWRDRIDCIWLLTTDAMQHAILAGWRVDSLVRRPWYNHLRAAWDSILRP